MGGAEAFMAPFWNSSGVGQLVQWPIFGVLLTSLETILVVLLTS